MPFILSNRLHLPLACCRLPTLIYPLPVYQSGSILPLACSRSGRFIPSFVIWIGQLLPLLAFLLRVFSAPCLGFGFIPKNAKRCPFAVLAIHYCWLLKFRGVAFRYALVFSWQAVHMSDICYFPLCQCLKIDLNFKFRHLKLINPKVLPGKKIF